MKTKKQVADNQNDDEEEIAKNENLIAILEDACGTQREAGAAPAKSNCIPGLRFWIHKVLSLFWKTRVGLNVRPGQQRA